MEDVVEIICSSNEDNKSASFKEYNNNTDSDDYEVDIT